MGESLQKNHEDCRKRDEFIEPLVFGAQIILVPQAMKILDAKAAVEKT